MNNAVKEILEDFESLSEPDKHRVAVEIRRRISANAAGDVPETITLSPEGQLAFWNALNEPVRLTEAQKRLGAIMRGEWPSASDEPDA